MKRLHLKLIPGREYLFTHKRKRTFRAVFKRIVRAPSTDAEDEFYFECEVDANLSRNPWTHTGDKALILLRPSLITVIQNAPAVPIYERQQILRNERTKFPGGEDDRTRGYLQRIRCALGDLKRKWAR